MTRLGVTTKPWPQPHIDLLRKLQNQGRSATEMPAMLAIAFHGAVYSRNAIVGKLDRLGLKMQAGAIAATSAMAYRNAGRKPQLAVSERGQVFEKVSRPSPYTGVKSSAWTPLPGSEPVPLMDLRRSSCRWPVELQHATEAMFCGCRAEEGGPYCRPHAQAAFRSSPARQAATEPTVSRRRAA